MALGDTAKGYQFKTADEIVLLARQCMKYRDASLQRELELDIHELGRTRDALAEKLRDAIADIERMSTKAAEVLELVRRLREDLQRLHSRGTR